MCIFGLNSKDKEIATENIKVLKVIKTKNKNLCSPIFSDEIWEIGVVKEVDFQISEDKFEFRSNKYLTTTGIYSFDISKDPKICLLLFSFFGNEKGDNLKIYEAEIPQGAEYIKHGNQYCSNKLKLIKEYVF